MKLVVQGWRAAGLAACMALFAACGGDGGTDTPEPAGIVATTAVTQNGFIGAPVAVLPAVRVTDEDGQAMAGVAVTFTVTGGGGTITGGAATTNASGIATLGGWTLGNAEGNNTVNATVSGLNPVTFTVTAQDPCEVTTAYTVGTTVNASLASYDCALESGEYVDFYGTTLANAQALSFNLTSSTVDTWLEMYDPTGFPLAFNDDRDDATTNSTIRVFAPSGNYFLGATSYDPGELGNYTLSSTGFGGNENCDEYWVVPGVSITGSITATDCDFGGFFTDEYRVVVNQGQTLTITMSSTAVDAWLELYDSGGNLVADDDDGAGDSNARIVYTATELDVLFIDASTLNQGETGAYTISITRS